MKKDYFFKWDEIRKFDKEVKTLLNSKVGIRL